MPTHLRICFGTLLAALTLLPLGCEKKGTSVDFGDNDPDTITALGDSITEDGYPRHLARMTGKNVIDGGSGGDPSVDGRNVISAVLFRDSPGYVLILYGANDILQGVEQKYTLANLRSMVDACKANKTVPVIGTLTPMRNVYSKYEVSAEELNNEIRQMAKETGARLADLHEAFGNNLSLTAADGLHTTTAGDSAIASTFAAQL